MKRKQQLTLLAATASIAILGLAGCSSASTDTGASSSAPKSASVSVTADPKLNALLPAEIKSAGLVKVGTEAYYPPYESLASDGKTIIGLDVDLLKAATERLGIKYQMTNVAFDTLLPSLKAGRFDMVVAAMSDTKERQASVNFVDYFQAGQAIIVKAGNPESIKGYADLCGKTVSVLKDSAQQTILQNLNKSTCASNHLTVLAQQSDNQALQQVQTGRSVANLAQDATGKYNANKIGGGKVFEVANAVALDPIPLGYAFPKDGKELTTAFQKSLQSLVDDGTYAKILARYDVGSGSVKTVTINGAK